jgi:hypothetical protein
LFGGKFDFALAIVDEHKVISRTVHLREINQHQTTLISTREVQSAKWGWPDRLR